MDPAMNLDRTEPKRLREASREMIQRAPADPQAMGEIYLIYYDRVFNYAMRRLLNVADAEDATASTFMKVVANLRQYRWTGRPFSAWIFRILTHQTIDILRRRSKHRVASIHGQEDASFELLAHMADDGLSQSERLIRLEQFNALHQAIAQLPPNCQEVVCLLYFADLSVKEIAYSTKSNVGIVKWRLHQSRRKLAQLLEKQSAQGGRCHEE